MKRAIPLLILAGVGGAGAYAIWRANEPDRRYARIDDLLREYQDKPHGAWTAEDTDELWRQVTWFNTRDRSGFVDRVVARVSSANASERCRAAMLASHIESYAALNRGMMVFVEPWLLPLPDPRKDRLDGFRFDQVPGEHPEAFARLAEDPGEAGRRSLVYLADASDAPALRDAFIRLLSREPLPGEREWILGALGGCEGDPVAVQTLTSWTVIGDIGSRFMAAAQLTALGDPAGTRLFIDLLTDLGNDLSRTERAVGCAVLAGRLQSLEPLRDDLSWAMDQGPEILEDVLRHWRSWLEIREHEGFRADAQAARDDAWEELER